MEKQLLSMAWRVGTRRKASSVWLIHMVLFGNVLQCLGGIYGLVTWHGEIALMSILGRAKNCAKSFTRVNRGNT